MQVLRCSLLLAAALLVGVPVVSGPPPTAPPSVKPVYMDYSTTDARAVSPNGKFEITVSGQETSLGAWVTVNEPARGWSIRVWPIERSVDVLWSPDSRAFALTDNRLANQSYVLTIGTKFHMSGPKLGVRCVDVTPLVRNAFALRAGRYYRERYGTPRYDGSYSFYARALRWVNNDLLLVSVSTVTSLPLPRHRLGAAAGVKGWTLGYLLDLRRRRVLRTFTEKSMRAEYGIDLSELAVRD